MSTRGFGMASTAPASSAFMSVAEFSSVRLEHITTGMGRCAISFFEEGDAVHARHLHVERDDVGHLLGDLASRRRKGRRRRR